MPSIFLACAPGLEPLLAREVEGLGLGRFDLAPGGLTLRGGLETIYRANLESGLALKVLVRIARFRAASMAELERGLAEIDWSASISVPPPRVTVSTHRSRLYHSGAVAERVAAAIAARGVRGQGEGPEVAVRIARDRCTVSVDTSGELLPRRGYRRATGKAPLRADLARALLMASGWDPSSPLFDPLCGSGTIAIEAALLARRRAPGLSRDFAFQTAPGFDAGLWSRLVDRAVGLERDGSPPIVASDRDSGAVRATLEAAARCGVEVHAEVAPLSNAPGLAMPGKGALCTNPPYGKRVSSDRDLRSLYQTLGRLVRERCSGWRVGLVAPDATLVAATGLNLQPAPWTRSGGLAVALWTGSIAERSS